MMMGSIYAAVTYLIALLFVTRNSPSLLILVLIVALSLFKQYLDVLLSTYAVLMSVYCYQIVDIHPRGRFNNAVLILLTVFLFTPFGLYPLIKGSIYVLYMAVAIISMGLLIWFKRWLLAFSIPMAFISASIFFWVYSGQPINGLLHYFSSMGVIIAGYSEAMIITGNTLEILVYLFVTFCLLVIALKRGGLNVKTLYLLLVISIYLFISFKSAFVRHDGHALFGAWALVFASIVLLIVFSSLELIFVLFLSALTLFYIDSHYDRLLMSRGLTPVLETYIWGMTGVKKRLFQNEEFGTEYRKTISSIKEKSKFPTLQGSVDTYPFDQAKLIANGYVWAPRPVFQSYAAYNPSLANLNHQHLLGKFAPDHLVFKVATIDERYPTLDDGVSWPTIIANYYPEGQSEEFLFLKKVQEKNEDPRLCALSDSVYSFGQEISIPTGGGLIFAEIDMQPTLLGKSMNLLFKTSEVRISIKLQNGQSKNYRIVPMMAQSGFILSPLIENTGDFKKIFLGKNASDLVSLESFSISPVNRFWQWEKVFTVRFKEVRYPQSGADQSSIQPCKNPN
jgi:hypothetical protein